MNLSSLVHHPVVQGTAFFLGINALARVGGGGDKRAIYASFDKPRWAPPPWVFGPAWAINDVTRIYADLDVLHRPPGRARTVALALEAASWLAYAAHNPLLFGKRSTKLSFGVAVLHLAATAGAAIAGRRFGRRFLLGLAPTAAWLLYATTLAGYVAIHNRDELIDRQADRNRLDLTIGTVFSAVRDWDLYAELTFRDRGTTMIPATTLPIVDGGFDQRQFVVGITRRFSAERGASRWVLAQ